MSPDFPIREGQILTGPVFNEPMQVETVRSIGSGAWVAGLVGEQSERFRRVTLAAEDISNLTIADSTLSYDGDGRLLCLDLQADVKSIHEAMERRRAPFYLRRTKEAMVYFPERQKDGTWSAQPVFNKRIPRTANFTIDGPEFDLYQKITRFVKRQSRRAAARSDDPRARAVGFLTSLYERRLASNTRAMRQSLKNLAKRLQDSFARAQDLARTAPPDLPDPEKLEEFEDSERERLEMMLEAVTLAGDAEQVREEIYELQELEAEAKAVEVSGFPADDAEAGQNARLACLRRILREEGFYELPDQRPLLFTEFQEPVRDPAQLQWRAVRKVKHYWMEVNAITQPMRIRENPPSYGGEA